MNSHAIYAAHRGPNHPRTHDPHNRVPPPVVPSPLLDEVQNCQAELNSDTDGAHAVGVVTMLIVVIVGCSLAYWAITTIP